MSDNDNQKNQVIFGTSLAITIFSIIWVILGVIAFIYSIYCFSKNGSPTENILGLVLAIFFGPFYFLYLYFAKSYCTNKK